MRRLPSRAAVEVKPTGRLWRRCREGEGESSRLNEALESVAEVELGREPIDETDVSLGIRCSDRARHAAPTLICGP